VTETGSIDFQGGLVVVSPFIVVYARRRGGYSDRRPLWRPLYPLVCVRPTARLNLRSRQNLYSSSSWSGALIVAIHVFQTVLVRLNHSPELLHHYAYKVTRRRTDSKASPLCIHLHARQIGTFTLVSQKIEGDSTTSLLWPLCVVGRTGLSRSKLQLFLTLTLERHFLLHLQ
jgi:hypothetical protein